MSCCNLVCYQAVVCTRLCSGIVSVEVIHFLECIGYGLSIDKPKLTKLAAELVPPLQQTNQYNVKQDIMVRRIKSTSYAKKKLKTRMVIGN